MTFAGFAAYCIALAIAAAIPGPGIVALVARALGSGFRATLPMALGLALGDLVYLTAAVLGLAFIAKLLAPYSWSSNMPARPICSTLPGSSGTRMRPSGTLAPSAPSRRGHRFCPVLR
jgi:hypothetical protein